MFNIKYQKEIHKVTNQSINKLHKKLTLKETIHMYIIV